MKYWIWLTKVNVKPITKYKLIQKYKLPEKIYKLNKSELVKEKLQQDEIKEILKVENRLNLDKYQKYINENNIELITINSKYYPKVLKNIYDPPIALYLKGNKNVLNTYSIAIIGCRKCSLYGEEMAKHISYELAKNNITVVSGLARGIDKFSHIGALAGNGKTIAVLGNGLDKIYPYENSKVANKIIQTNGAIISEYIPGTKPNKENFPQRNRIISGLSNLVVVVEAKKRSGTMITVDFALEQGKDVYAVPRKCYKRKF